MEYKKLQKIEENSDLSETNQNNVKLLSFLTIILWLITLSQNTYISKHLQGDYLTWIKQKKNNPDKGGWS